MKTTHAVGWPVVQRVADCTHNVESVVEITEEEAHLIYLKLPPRVD